MSRQALETCAKTEAIVSYNELNQLAAELYGKSGCRRQVKIWKYVCKTPPEHPRSRPPPSHTFLNLELGKIAHCDILQ
jgi:hypothetical protein